MTSSDSTSKQSATLTKETLPLAIGNLFSMNNYDVEYNVNVHGAQIDIVARAKGDPFSFPVYVEATVEYVSTEKYGKDTTKFILLSRKDPGCRLLCVSSQGFTAFVKERATESGVTALTYDELFAKFEKFTPYLNLALSEEDTQKLALSYEEPLFNDNKGVDSATKWLGYWRGFAPEQAKWLIILGEYGTGKTSLTKIIQYRWIQEYKNNPTLPIPVRIELRNFSRQFDAKGLLHHFLDTNALSHVPIEFMMHLIKTGRVILLLDGYDEMAQYLNARERRACLSALAELSADGAKGILTSRPNYFTEAEELSVFEALYKTLEQNKFHVSRLDRAFIAEEKSVDELVERYVLNRYERTLQDLTPQQTESLVKRTLEKDPEGQKIVLNILQKVFRDEGDGKKQALSGKPVIIAYLLELLDEIRSAPEKWDISTLTEWQVYKLIVDRLMFRDLRRSPLDPGERRHALQKLAIIISGRDVVVADETTFQTVIDEDFQAELRRLPADERRLRRAELFEDLRSSATLTRAVAVKKDGWVFSHNSLREFLTAEAFLESLLTRTPQTIKIPISSAMRGFAASIGTSDIEALWQALSELWPQRANGHELGLYLVLLWDAARRSPGGVRKILNRLSGGDSSTAYLSNITLKEINFSEDFLGESLKINATDSVISDSSFMGISLTESTLEGAVLDSVSFRDSDLSLTNFKSAYIFECDFTGANVHGADFSNLISDSSIIVSIEEGKAVSLAGKAAIGYLRYNGAKTDDVENIYVYKNHQRFSILQKILEKISDQRNSQLRGLTQRGEARIDPPFAREFIDHLVSLGWVSIGRNELVSVTPAGRTAVQTIVSGKDLPTEIVGFLAERR